jgi:DNA-binding NarL/FixJ family response regulator
LTKESSGAGTGGASPPEKLVRILLVDDNEPWRHWVRSMLTNHAGLRIVCEVSDGIEAVQKAKELQPDLILLDIGLPRLNGIEAAGQIRQVSADSDILFLSQNHDADIVQAALSTSARGYVLKVRAARELAAAIEAVLRGERFIGRGLEGGELLAEPNAQATNHIDEHHAVTPTTPSNTENGYHEVQFYVDDAVLEERFASFISDALRTGNAAIVFATKSHQDGLCARLQTRGLDVSAAADEGRFISLDAADTLSDFMVNGLPDPVLFLEGLTSLIESASKAAAAEHPRVALCGERVGLLWAEGNADGAIRLEQLVNEMAKTRDDIDILCAYPLRSAQREMDSETFERICAEHSATSSQ